MEDAHNGETITDIQNYLTSFNKDIQQQDSSPISHGELSAVSQVSGEVTQVFMDEAGRYFYHTVDGGSQQVVVVTDDPEQEAGVNEVEEHTISSNDHHHTITTNDTISNATTVIVGNHHQQPQHLHNVLSTTATTVITDVTSTGDTINVTNNNSGICTIGGDGRTISGTLDISGSATVANANIGTVGNGSIKAIGNTGTVHQHKISMSGMPNKMSIGAGRQQAKLTSGKLSSIKAIDREAIISIKSPLVLETKEVDETDPNDEALQSLAGAIASVGEDGLLQIGDVSSGVPNQVILNTGTSNQIVTIVPSSTNPGEMSYVLIVEQSNDESMDKDHNVYDFTEGEDAITFSEEEDETQVGNSNKGGRTHHKRSQSSSCQAHMCNYCNYTSTKRYLLTRHMRSHSEERPHKCSVCDRGFKTLGSLQNHLNTHTGVKPHRCKFCDTGFTTSGELVRHVRYIHTLEKPHKCSECDYSSVELSKLKRHMRCHTGERPYQCIHCTYASPDTFKLKRHLRIHTGEKPYECPTCNARFTQSNSLKAHRLIHTGNKPVYTCELCPTTCGRKTDLRIHIQKLHTSDKPIKCKKCTKIFPDRYSFKLHNKSHDGEKCFKCDLCPYASTSSRHLDSHMLVHTEQKPYRCDLCEQSFRQKQLLRRHQNLYHNPQYIPPTPREKTQECTECGKAFRHKGNLIRHMAIHDPDASAQEKAQALKIGRQKRLQLINGQEVEVYTNEEDEDADLMAVEGHDGNQYVVLEVIQLQDGGGHHVMIGDDLPLDGEMSGSSLVVQQDHSINTAMLGSTLMPEEIKKETKKEMDTCFGFDEDGEAGHIHLEFGE
uniref:CCCTC-binding factor n=2 Tax=Hirondellea gigas TaxID=1518452 RepID=A0A6A7G3A1_9CRUS